MEQFGLAIIAGKLRSSNLDPFTSGTMSSRSSLFLKKDELSMTVQPFSIAWDAWDSATDDPAEKNATLALLKSKSWRSSISIIFSKYLI